MNVLENVDMQYQKKITISPISWIKAYVVIYKKRIFPVPMSIPKTMQIRYGLCTVEFEGKVYKFKFTDYESQGWVEDDFCHQPYKRLNVKGKIVVDVGCANGSTAVYFMARGASQVYSFDINQKVCLEAKENAHYNDFQDSIHVFNKECNLDKLSLPQGNKVMKVDCEGGEYDLFLKAKDSSILQFDEIIGEYHYGYKNLRERFEGLGYSFTFDPPESFSLFYPPHAMSGLFYAVKK